MRPDDDSSSSPHNPPLHFEELDWQKAPSPLFVRRSTFGAEESATLT